MESSRGWHVPSASPSFLCGSLGPIGAVATLGVDRAIESREYPSSGIWFAKEPVMRDLRTQHVGSRLTKFLPSTFTPC